MQKVRDKRIDVIRGIAIILVVLQHSIGASNIVGKCILAFHMPLFFVISGYLQNQSGGVSGFIKTVLKYIRNLLVPQAMLALITWLYNFLISYLILHRPDELEFNPFYCFSEWWFLLVLFQVSVLWEIIRRFITKDKEKWIIWSMVVACVVYTLLIPSGTRGVLYCAITPTAFLFYLLGHECKRLDLRRYENRCFIIPVLIVLLCGLSYYNEPIFMYSNTYGHPIVFLLTSTIGVVLVYAISKHLQDNRFLIWCGVNSIYIYVLHLKIRVAVNAVVMSFDMIPDFVQGLTIFVITGIITLCGCVICKRYLWFMFGDKSRRFIDK